MRQPEHIRVLLWGKKVALLEKCVREGAVTLDFPEEQEAQTFLNMLTNFRGTVSRNKKKYPGEWGLVSLVSFRRVDSKVTLFPKVSLQRGNVSLLQVAETLDL